MMKSMTTSAACGAVDKPATQPYLSAIVSMARALIFAAFSIVGSRNAQFQLIRRMLPGSDGAAARHGELIGNQVDQAAAATLHRES
jgi:hypothetical protein